jgi:hypothetical protein
MDIPDAAKTAGRSVIIEQGRDPYIQGLKKRSLKSKDLTLETY